MLDGLSQDVRYALRSLRLSPGFAAAAIVSLSLGIGANTAIFSLIDAVMLESLPVPHPEELLQVMEREHSYEGYSNIAADSSLPRSRFISIGTLMDAPATGSWNNNEETYKSVNVSFKDWLGRYPTL